jgi:hypothetical protein
MVIKCLELKNNVRMLSYLNPMSHILNGYWGDFTWFAGSRGEQLAQQFGSKLGLICLGWPDSYLPWVAMSLLCLGWP